MLPLTASCWRMYQPQEMGGIQVENKFDSILRATTDKDAIIIYTSVSAVFDRGRTLRDPFINAIYKWITLQLDYTR